jgi:hypothetical protein
MAVRQTVYAPQTTWLNISNGEKMKSLACIVTFSVMALSVAKPVYADAGCNGILNSNEILGFDTFFAPPFSPSLSMENGKQVKPMSQSEFNTMSNSSMAPLAKQKLTAQQAKNLKGWLNNHSTSSIPGWFSTGLGLAKGVMGLIADIAVQGINATTSDAQTLAGNLAGKVEEGGLVGVVPSAIMANGGKKFIWAYMYQVNIEGKSYAYNLYACQADIKIK